MIGDALIRWFVPRPEAVSDPKVRERYGTLEGVVSILVNLVVFVVKLVPGVMIGSISLVADAFHSLGDVLSSVAVIWGFRLAAKPPDREHPFGHGRMENVASLVVALLLMLTAWEFGKASVARLLHPRPVVVTPLLLAVLLVTLLLKEWLARFSLHAGRAIDSSALIGDFWHHRSDVVATGVVMVALVAAQLGFPRLDGAGGLVVSLFIAWAAAHLLRDSVSPLIGEAPASQLLDAVRASACASAEVQDVHDVIVHRYGELLVTSLHIEIPAQTSLVRAHEIAEEVEDRVNRTIGGWSVVHVDPVDSAHPLYEAVRAVLEREVSVLGVEASVFDLRIIGGLAPAFVVFDLRVGDGGDDKAASSRLRSAVMGEFPGVARVIVNVRPHYVY